jgi:hypothetical protein
MSFCKRRYPGQPADAVHCWFASLTLIVAHRPKIMFGVLEVILRHDPVPGQSFGAGQGRIAFIASLEIVNVTGLEADDSGRLIFLAGGSGSSPHGVGHRFRILARLPAAGLSFEMYFILVPTPKPANVRSRRWGAPYAEGVSISSELPTDRRGPRRSRE